MTKRLKIQTGRNSINGFRVWFWLNSPNKWKDMFDQFAMDWGKIFLSFHLLKWRCDICYIYGRKCRLD